MSKSSLSVKSGIGIGGLVFIVFLVFKLAQIGVVANWSWWWVTSPLWIPIVGIIAVSLIWLIGFVIYHTLRK